MRRAHCVTIAAAIAIASIGVGAQIGDVNQLLARVGERLEQHYKRAQNVVFAEKKTLQPITSGFSPLGFARTTEYELRVEADSGLEGDGSAEVKIVRQLLRINGRAPRERDKKDRNSCTDENPLSEEPLSFLLPANREEYSFVVAGPGKGKDAHTVMIDFISATPPEKGEIKESPRGIDGCFSVSLPGAVKGRVWVDASNYDVVRVERRMAGIADLPVPFKLARRHNMTDNLVVERYDTTIRYKPVAFSDPEETMLLPEAIDTVLIYRSGLESIRSRQTFSEYRRFVTGARIVK